MRTRPNRVPSRSENESARRTSIRSSVASVATEMRATSPHAYPALPTAASMPWTRTTARTDGPPEDDTVEDAWALQIAPPGEPIEPQGSCAQPGGPAVRD